MTLAGWEVTESADGGWLYYHTADPGNYYTPDEMAMIIADTGSASTVGVASNDWFDMVTKILPQIPGYITAYQLAQVNVERAQRGLPPLNTASYGPRVGVNFTPQTQQMLMFGIIGLVAVMLFTRRGR